MWVDRDASESGVDINFEEGWTEITTILQLAQKIRETIKRVMLHALLCVRVSIDTLRFLAATLLTWSPAEVIDYPNFCATICALLQTKRRFSKCGRVCDRPVLL